MNRTTALLLSAIAMLPAGMSHAEGITDTVRLASVQVVGRVQFGMSYIGSQERALSSALLGRNPASSLSDLLTGNSLLNVKSLGGAGVATASFRGASSYQTQIDWNGISITPPSLGDLDLSQIPAFFIDHVTMLPGGGNARTGLGAIGGAIELDNTPDFSGPSMTATGQYGSYDTWSAGYKVRMGDSRTSATTRLFYRRSDNDFRYPDTAEPRKVRRSDADYDGVGVMQDFYRRLRKGGTLSANAWYQRSDNSLPSSVEYPSDAKSDQITSSLRTRAGFERQSGAHGYKAAIAYIRDMTDYTSRSATMGDTDALTIGNSYIAKADYTFTPQGGLSFGAGADYRHENVLSDNFEGKEAHRNTLSAKIYGLWEPGERFALRMQYLPSLTDGDFAHGYAVGVGYDIVPELLSAGATHSFSKRFPALNDMYFAGSANPDLRPERGFSFDATLSFTPTLGPLRLSVEATYFNLNIVDWIEWAPQSEGSWIWLPKNVKHALSRGVELSADAFITAGRTSHRLTFNYAHTSTTDQNQGDIQLQYVPLNKWNGRYLFETGGLFASYDIYRTGNRWDESRRPMPPHTIHGLQAGYTFRTGRGSTTTLSGRIDNLLNTYYQSSAGYPMPLRTGHIAVTFTM